MQRNRLTATSLRLDQAPIALLAAVLAALPGAAQAQDYRSSVVGTEFDFILETDPSTFLCLEYKGQGLREMPDKTGHGQLVQRAFIFVSYFDDGTSVDMAIDADFETVDEARAEALRYVHRLGKLPTSLRRGVQRVVVHYGEEDTTAFSDAGLIVLYSANATRRIATHDLEETVFHESVHASWDQEHAGSPAWHEAQRTDATFVTDYARDHPDGEDLAESALFAYTLVHHPERIPAADAARIRNSIPARIAFVEALLPAGEPVFERVGPSYACDGSGTTFTVRPPRGQPAPPADRPEGDGGSACDVDISSPGGLSDVLSNALLVGLEQDEAAVFSFLDGAGDRYSSADELLEAAVTEFGIDRATLDSQVEEFLHCNCEHGDLEQAPKDD
jgi:hypothetical protein